MSSSRERTMKRKLFGSSEHDERGEGNTGEKKRRRKNVEVPKHYPLSERQQLALLMQMTSAENSPEPSSPPPTIRRTPGGSGRKDKIHKRNERGETLLHLSTIRGDLDAMKELIRQGAEVNVQDFAGWTPLHEACNHGHQEITKYLLEVGANVNSRGLEDDTPLHDAVTNAHKDLVELLLKHGANPLLANKRGERPLDIADDTEVRELLQKEVMLSDESETSSSSSEDEMFSSLTKVKEIKRLQEGKEKMRTTSNCSSSSRELFKSSNNKKKQKKKMNVKKNKSFFSSDSSSSDSDDSDDKPLIQKRTSLPKPVSHHSTPQSNGWRQKILGKTPVLNVTPVSTLSKPKVNTSKRSKSGKEKRKVSLSKEKLTSSSSSSSSEFTSDSEYETPKKSEYLASSKYSTTYSSFSVDNRKDSIKERSTYSSESKPSRMYDKKSTPQTVHLEKDKAQSHTKRTKSYSSEEELPLSKVKSKVHKSAEIKSKSSSSFSSFPDSRLLSDSGESHSSSLGTSVQNILKTEADESVYDFSLSTEDFTDVSGISLKSSTKPKDKASELFDTICLGKTSEGSTFKSDLNFSPGQKKTYGVKPKTLFSDNTREFSKAPKYSYTPDFTLDKNSNKIEIFKSETSPSKITLGTPYEKTSESRNSFDFSSNISSLPVVEKTPEKQPASPIKSTDQKPNLSSLQSTGSYREASQHNTTPQSTPTTSKNEVKLEKKQKEKSKTSSSFDTTPSFSYNKVTDTTASKSGIESNFGAKKTGKTENSFESIIDKVSKEYSVMSDVKTPGTVEKDQGKMGFVKKKKKHKASKSSNDLSALEVKERNRKTSSEILLPDVSSTAEKDSSSKPVSDKTLHKAKWDPIKSGQISRKSSQEGKSDTSTASSTSSSTPVRKKVKINDPGDSEAAKVVSKTPSSVTKASKPEKQHSATPTSAKKDKSETKKITLVSDANSFFLSELEKSSRQRELEKLKLKRKKKKLLQQQQKLKVHKSGETGSKDGGSLPSLADKKLSESPAVIQVPTEQRAEENVSQTPADRIGSESEKSAFIVQQQTPLIPVQAFAADKVKMQTTPGYFTPLHTQHMSMQNLRQHDSLPVEMPPIFHHHQEVFKSPSVPGRSISQVDEKSADRLAPHQPVTWQSDEKLQYMSVEKRGLPVQRSLSFTGSPNDGLTLRPPFPIPHLPYPAIPQSDEGNKKFIHEITPHMKTVPTSNMYGFSTVPTLPTQSYSNTATSAFITSTLPAATSVTGNDIVTYTLLTSSPMKDNQLTSISEKKSIADMSYSGPVTKMSAVVPSTSIIGHDIKNVMTTTAAVTSSTNVFVAATQQTSRTDSIKDPSAVPDVSDTASTQISTDGKVKEPDGKHSEKIEKSGNDASDRKDDIDESKENNEEDQVESMSEDKKEDGNEEGSTSDEEIERKRALEKYVAERLSNLKVVIEEPKPRRLPVFIPMEKLKSVPRKDPVMDHLNVYEEWAMIQRQISERRKKCAAMVIPQAPQCYWEYMTFTGGYLLSGSRESWLSVPVLAPPPLNEEMQALFMEHEKERVKLRLQHASQREKLIVACEQEIMRVYSRAARTHQNQQVPFSACTVLLDREVYNIEHRNKKVSDGDHSTNRTAAIRDRFNTRMFLSWLQDVDDKYEKMKNALLTRQRHEAQALHAVQRTEWLLKLQEVEHQGQQRLSSLKPEDISELHVPLVNIADDFDLLPS